MVYVKKIMKHKANQAYTCKYLTLYLYLLWSMLNNKETHSSPNPNFFSGYCSLKPNSFKHKLAESFTIFFRIAFSLNI